MLEEKPQVEEIEGNIITRKAFSGAEAEHVTFSYEDEVILDDYSLQIQPGKILGIHGASGSGKSTLLKLLGCRFRKYQSRWGRCMSDSNQTAS